jgi:hypothetical protein
MTHSTAGGIIRSRLRRRSEGCFDWTMHIDILVQLLSSPVTKEDQNELPGNPWQFPLASLRSSRFSVGTSYSTDLPVPNGPASQSITWNRALKPSKWKQHPGSASANHASNLYLLPHMPTAGALSHTKLSSSFSRSACNDVVFRHDTSARSRW